MHSKLNHNRQNAKTTIAKNAKTQKRTHPNLKAHAPPLAFGSGWGGVAAPPLANATHAPLYSSLAIERENRNFDVLQCFFTENQ